MNELMPLLCDEKCAGVKKTLHELIEKKSKTEYLVKCKKCGTKSQVYYLVWEHALNRPRQANLTKYPRYEPHTGQLVNSPQHEKETLKAMGFHAAPHGIDHRYDDAPNEKARDISLDLHE